MLGKNLNKNLVWNDLKKIQCYKELIVKKVHQKRQRNDRELKIIERKRILTCNKEHTDDLFWSSKQKL